MHIHHLGSLQGNGNLVLEVVLRSPSSLQVCYSVKQSAFEHSSPVFSNFPYVPTNVSTFIGSSACSYKQMLFHCCLQKPLRLLERWRSQYLNASFVPQGTKVFVAGGHLLPPRQDSYSVLSVLKLNFPALATSMDSR